MLTPVYVFPLSGHTNMLQVDMPRLTSAHLLYTFTTFSDCHLTVNTYSLNTQRLKGNVICLWWETIFSPFHCTWAHFNISQAYFCLIGKHNMSVLFRCHFLADISRRCVTERMKGWDEGAERGQCVNLSSNHMRWRPRWKLLSLWEGRPTLGRVRVWKIADPAPQH